MTRNQLLDAEPPGGWCGTTVKELAVDGFRISEAVYAPDREIPPQPRGWADLCLALEGGYREEYGRTRLRCEPASLVFHPPYAVYSDRISAKGSRCLNIQIDPKVLWSLTDGDVALDRLTLPRHGVLSWLAFQLRAEFELRDDLSAVVVESHVLSILAELAGRPAFEIRGPPPPWLERARERIDDEFIGSLSLETLARTAGVHRVHLARAFRAHFGCTVRSCIRQRRLESPAASSSRRGRR
jgi:AraC family transcriptional regulator